ncbi:hypothetical protein VTP01DRAFT_7073 [Rhizomucor pusillus]|uniref:uncharacterized protein n=1 Tax=Rhizomucor pusillus TaxID=4840 RepID=UPI00374354EA
MITSHQQSLLAPGIHHYSQQPQSITALERIAPRKAPGSDHITGAMLRPIAETLCRLLADFFTLCLRWAWIPVAWRTAQVVPIYKKVTRMILATIVLLASLAFSEISWSVVYYLSFSMPFPH